jgi:ATP-dependent RNA helicase DeaD
LPSRAQAPSREAPALRGERTEVAPQVAARVAPPEERSGTEDDDAFLQLFVNVGKRDGVRASDLQKLLSDRGVAIDPAASIRMRDRMSFVRVPKELFDDAVAALSGQVLGGRTVVAELARGSRA